ncbi:MAG: TraR/DksA C4-type zinc finger protein [Chloroflexi bacterium]|nr:TraR/DksA C4-type zinc finger protein [Chloroflexota bacterium]
MQAFDVLLKESVALHGHLCPGQVIGVRMGILGCTLVGIEDPRRSKSLLVYVEIDRCATDALQSVTGCTLGRRTLKYVDYGKVAATFLNTQTGRAYRVLARDDAREPAYAYAPPGASKQEAQLQGYSVMPYDELFRVRPVLLQPPEEDQPGHSASRVACETCGEGVNDRREVRAEGRVFCRACAHGAYYQPLAAGSPIPVVSVRDI